MAAQVMSINTGGSFLDSPGYNPGRTKIPPSGFSRRDMGPPIRFDAQNFEEDLGKSYKTPSQLNTPDSGFSGTASSTLLKTPESDISSSAAATPSSSGSVSTHRKRKTVNFDESQTSVVVISPDDLFITYSKHQNERQEQLPLESDTAEPPLEPGTQDLPSPDDPHAKYVVDSLTGWPLKRSESLESRDNPFLPGGELSREAEDLLRRATIIRDNFYLNEEEKRTLQEQQLLQQQQQKQQRSTKKVQILDQDGHAYNGSACEKQPLTPSPTGEVEERISPQSATNALAAAPHGGDANSSQPKENGKAGADGASASPDSVKFTIPDSDGQSIPLTQAGPGGGQSPAGGGDLQVHDSDKKRRNKCCSVM